MDGNTKNNTTSDHDANGREYIRNASWMDQQYMSQHCSPGDSELAMANQMFDLMGVAGLTKVAPMYKSGINPNYFDEYFSDLEKSDLTNSAECRTALWNEYQTRRWGYVQHLIGYKEGVIQDENRKVTTVELWRRLGLNGKPTRFIVDWYFDKDRMLGDILHRSLVPYTQGLSILYANFGNCPVPPNQTLAFGSVHVAVGFVDLGILLDSRFIESKDGNKSKCLLLRGFDTNSFSVAKSLVLWDMMGTVGTKAAWVVQVWFSSVWSKKATNAFLASACRVAALQCNMTSSQYPFEVNSLVHHWAQSKGVGLKRLVKRRSQTRKESSYALHFASKEDRVEMIRYHLTGAFGLALAGEEPCSSSVTMFDCPRVIPHKTEAASVFETLTLRDVVSSDQFNGSYFQTAEKVKEQRVCALMDYIQAGRIKIHLSVHHLSLKSIAQMKEITSLKPKSMSWSNVLDYMSREEFHKLAQSCSSSATHSGYSMNWPGITYGASLIDYPDTSLSVIRKAEKATVASFRNVCGQRRIFSTPIQSNPLNITHSFLAKKCHMYWVRHFFDGDNIKLVDSGLMDDIGNPLGRIPGVVSCVWMYEKDGSMYCAN